jgi:hypothetical protein
VDGTTLAFTSDRSGIFNIYMKDLPDGEEYPITNVITGISHLSWTGDGSRMAFVAFYEAGYDVYLLRNPFDIKPGQISPAKTGFITARESKQDVRHVLADQIHEKHEKKTENHFRNFVFGEEFAGGVRTPVLEELKPVALDSAAHLLPGGRHKVHGYKTKFSADVLSGNAGYSQYFGVRGLTQLSFSDVLGNHRFNLYTNLYGEIKNSNFFANYWYLPKRTDLGVTGFQTAYFF